jgi:hypothetical protein
MGFLYIYPSLLCTLIDTQVLQSTEYASVAQLDRALVSGTKGRRFESCRVHHFFLVQASYNVYMAKRKNLKPNTIVLRIPSWAAKAYVILAIVLVPWTVYLGLSLPTHHLSSHWDVSWTGLDIALSVSFLLTGLFAFLRSMWVVITASTTGSLLLVDAWFDIMSEHGGRLFHQALFAAFLFEIPLALMSYYLAGHALQRTTRASNKIK